MHKIDKTSKLEKKLLEYLRVRARKMGALYAWVTSRNFVEEFEEIKRRNSARRILRRCKDIIEIRHP